MPASLASALACLPERYVLTLLGFLLTIIVSIMKFSISITITEMVLPIEIPVHRIATDPNTCPYTAPPPLNPDVEVWAGHFDWSEATQGVIFGALYWSYMPLQVPLGRVVETLGPRHILGGGILLASLSCLLTPLVVNWMGAPGFVAIRVIMGIGLATTYPSINVVLAKWAPPEEKTKLGSFIFSGENIGIILSMALSGVILGNAKGNWPQLFYVYGGAGLTWVLLWACFGYNDPGSHPFISAREKAYLQSCMSSNLKKNAVPTPWMEILKSAPVWGVVIAHIGHDWGLITIVTLLPKYMKSVLHYEIESNGLLSAIPYVAMTVIAVVSGWFSDWVIYKDYLSITSARKLFTCLAAVGPSLGVVAAMYAGCDSALVVVMFAIGMAFMGFFYSGLALNTLDLSPNYSGTLAGLIAYGGLGGIISPYLAGVLAPQGTMMQWKTVFWVAVTVLIATTSLFVAVGSGKVQSWNDHKPQSSPEYSREKLQQRQQDREYV